VALSDPTEGRGSAMDKFIHRENLALFRRRLADPGLSDAQRKAILILLAEERGKHLHRSVPMTDRDKGQGQWPTDS
jgi:hypothetical protein